MQAVVWEIKDFPELLPQFYHGCVEITPNLDKKAATFKTES